MDFSFTEKQNQLREEVIEFLKGEMDSGEFSPGTNAFLERLSPKFSKKVSEKGWLGIAWPKEYGGRGLGYTERILVLEEMFRYGAPIALHYMADRQVGPGIIHFGSDFLKKEFLSKILNAEVTFCLLFSEPDAGSDLANSRTTAVDKGDHYVVNGQKVWTSLGHHADYGWALVRTVNDPAVSKYDSFSEIIIDMKSPGVTVRPLINIVGVHSFNEVFFDNVKVGKEYLVGKGGNGFRQVMTNLDYERSSIDRLMQNYMVKENLLEFVKNNSSNGRPLCEDSLIRDKVAQLEIEYKVGWLFIYYICSILDSGKMPSFEAAMGKTYCTLFEARLSDVASSIMGLHGLLMPESPEALFEGIVGESYLWSPSFTLQGGSVEVLKNIVARRGLKLPTK